MPDLNPFGPEFRFLLACTLPPVDAVEIERLRQAAVACTDWAALIELVRRHELPSLVECNLRTHAADLVPANLLAQFKEFRIANQQQSALLMLELAAVGQAFAPANIPSCPLKGPWLAQRLYGSPALRLSGDVDLLIAPESIWAADAALLADGYKRTSPSVALSPRQWQMYRRIIHHTVYHHPRRRLHIELHWTLATPDLIPSCVTHEFLSRARPLSQPAVLALRDEDLLCFLLVHGARHAWENLKWLVDIAMFLRQNPGPDWLVVYEQMASWGLESILGQALLLARDLFAAPIPGPLWHLLEGRSARKLAAQALGVICSENGFGKDRGHFRRLRSLAYRTGFKPSIGYKLSIFSQILVVDDDWEDLKLPDWLFPLYFILRPFLWLRRYYLPHRQP